jgi:hypothetical protein
MVTIRNGKPHFDRAAITGRAWEMMRDEYGFGRLTIRDLGWHIFGACMRRAWAAAKRAAAEAMRSAEDRAAEMQRLVNELAEISGLTIGASARRREREILARFAELQRFAA